MDLYHANNILFGSYVKELISPIQYALETMISVNKELRSVIGRQKADVKLNINPLSMKLQGIVEAAVQGGTANYEKVLHYTKLSA
jgi:hypothetical protein